MAAITLGESLDQSVLVFKYPAPEVVCHSNVNHARFTGDDVDAVTVIVHDQEKKQVPRLRIGIGFANPNATLGMTTFLYGGNDFC